MRWLIVAVLMLAGMRAHAEEAPTTTTSATAAAAPSTSSSDEQWQRQKRAADAERAAGEAQQHADRAILWYGIGGSLLAASVASCLLWAFVCGTPLALIGAGACAVAGGGAVIYGLIESASASAAQTKAQAMAY